MPSFFIMAFRVVRGIPRRAAVALTTPLVSRNTRRMWSRSTCSSVSVPIPAVSALNSARGARSAPVAARDVQLDVVAALADAEAHSLAHLLDAVGETFEQLTGSRELLMQFGVENTRRVLC